MSLSRLLPLIPVIALAGCPKSGELPKQTEDDSDLNTHLQIADQCAQDLHEARMSYQEVIGREGNSSGYGEYGGHITDPRGIRTVDIVAPETGFRAIEVARGNLRLTFERLETDGDFFLETVSQDGDVGFLLSSDATLMAVNTPNGQGYDASSTAGDSTHLSWIPLRINVPEKSLVDGGWPPLSFNPNFVHGKGLNEARSWLMEFNGSCSESLGVLNEAMD